MSIDPQRQFATTAMELREAPVSDCLDASVVAGLLELGDPDFFAELVDDFITSTGPCLERMREAVAFGEAEVTYQCAHTLKSSAANMGATRFSDLCRRIEATGRAGDVSGLDAIIADLSQEYDRVHDALTAAAEAARG